MEIDPDIIMSDVLTEYKRIQKLEYNNVIQKQLPQETRAVVNVMCKLLEKLQGNTSYKIDNGGDTCKY